MSCISSYSGHFSDLYFLTVRTTRFFLHLVSAWLLINVSVYDTFIFLPSSTPVNQHISGGARTFQPWTFRPRTFRPEHLGHGHFGHGNVKRQPFQP